MKTITKEELQTLADFTDVNCVSIYIPTHKKGKEVNEGQDAILLKNHYQKIRQHLKERDIPENEADQYLSPIRKLIDDTDFWRHQEQGLAVFLGNDYFKYLKLPYSGREFSTLSTSFHLDQLVPFFTQDDQYFILAISMDKVRVLEANPHHVRELEVDGILKEGINEIYKQYDFEKGMLNQSSSQGGGYPGPGTVPKGGGGPNPSGNKGGATFHGHGSSPADNDVFIEEYFRNVHDELDRYIPNDKVPVVLAGVERLHPTFKKANKSFNIFEKGIAGNYDETNAQELHKKSLDLIQPHLDEQMYQLRDKYQEMAGTGKASYQIDDIAPAALDGRIDTLFVVKGAHKWGVINREDNSVILHDNQNENDHDLVSKAAIDTILNGGNAYFVDKERLPESVEDAELAAIFRW